MKRYIQSATLISALLFLNVLAADAGVKLPSIFSDNMVLQQKREIPVWGKADPGEMVTVTIRNQKESTIAGADGKWIVKLKPIQADTNPLKMTVTGKNSVSCRNILIGEVWICSGQSNMNFRVSNAANSEEEIATADNPNIRLFSLKRNIAYEPQDDCDGEWTECNPRTVGEFSAVGYFFGRELTHAINVPVGLIQTAVGGSPAEAWTRYNTLNAFLDFRPILARFGQAILEFPAKQTIYEQQLQKWELTEPNTRGRKPRPPLGPDHHHRPAGLYNGMIAPLIPYAIAGAIWYQGENNANTDRSYQYRSLFPTMIQDWRELWGQGDFPFLFVQLANYRRVEDEPGESDWAELREAQLMTLSLPNTGMAVAIDIGEADDIHPKNKQDVGYRLTLAARHKVYGEDIVYSGPLYESMIIANGKAHIRFKHIGGGLMSKGPLKGFAVAGRDRKFVWAEAEIEGNTVTVWNETIPDPVAVRYAWADNPVCNLYNTEGLPASPFRTDNFPILSVNNR